MGLKIVVPSSLATLGAWLNILALQDVLDRLTTDPGDTKAAEFTQNLGIAETGLLGDLNHKVAQHLAFAMRLTNSRLAALGLWPPAVEGAGSTIEISSSMAAPSGSPNFSKRSRSVRRV